MTPTSWSLIAGNENPTVSAIICRSGNRCLLPGAALEALGGVLMLGSTEGAASARGREATLSVHWLSTASLAIGIIATVGTGYDRRWPEQREPRTC
jgi:hypothetical protein